MSKRFLGNYGSGELKSRVKAVIETKNKDSLKNHLQQTILFKDNSKVSGIINNKSFKIWLYDGDLNGVTGIFYPIVEGKFKSFGQGFEIEFKTKMNVVGKTIFLLIATMLGFGIVSEIIIQEDNDLRYLILRSLLGIVLFGLMISVPTIIFYRTSRAIKQHLIAELELRIG